jgi:hypothetical protein
MNTGLAIPTTMVLFASIAGLFQGVPVQDRPIEGLPEDGRLIRPISLDQAGISLKRLLQEVSDRNLRLECSRTCADQKVQIRLKDRPLRALMEALAELLPGTWEPLDNGKGYRLQMDSGAVARRDRWWNLYNRERERALAEIRQAALEQLQEEPYRRKPGDPNTENSNVELEKETAAHEDFFRSLPQSLQERIVGRMTELPFERTMLAWGSEDDETATIVSLQSLPLVAQEALRKRAAMILRTDPEGLPIAGSQATFIYSGMNLCGGVMFGDGRMTGPAIIRRFKLSEPSSVIALNHAHLPRLVEQLGVAAPQPLRQLAAYQTARVWPNDSSPKYRMTSFPPVRRPDLLNWLADRGDIEFVADYYSQPGTVMTAAERKKPLGRPLKEELDYRAFEHDMSWKKGQGDIYLFRNNRWYRDDYLEVPEGVVQRLIESRHPKAPSAQEESGAQRLRRQMDWETDVVASLSRYQIGTGLKWAAREEVDMEKPEVQARRLGSFSVDLCPFFMESDRIMVEYRTLKLYASLSPSAKSALVEGRLPVSALTVEQKEAALSLSPPLVGALASQYADRVLLGLKPQLDMAKVPVGVGVRVRLVITYPAQPGAK